MSRDRVTEGYHKKAFLKQDQDILRERVHWMCSQVSGERVLDVGCSKGTTSLLLAKEGYSVVGIDPDPEAISYAQKALKQEPVDLSTRLTFVLGDIFEYQFDRSDFDAVILGKIFEHMTSPEKLIITCKKFLKPEGKIIITIPFAIHPDKDHKLTFTLSKFEDLISRHLSIQDLSIKNSYIQCTAINSSYTKKSFSRTELLEMTERAMLEMQRRYLEQDEENKFQIQTGDTQVKQLKRQIQDQETGTQELNAALETAGQEREDLKSEIQSLNLQVERLTTQIQKKEINIEQLETELDHLKDEPYKLKASLQFKDRQLDRISAQIQAKEQKINRATHNYYWTKYILKKTQSSAIYQLGLTLINSVTKPGLKTLTAPYKTIKWFFSGIKSAVYKSAPVVASLLIKLPAGKEDILPLTTAKPKFLDIDDKIVSFDVPDSEPCYLSSKKNSNFQEPPQQDIIGLKPDTYYTFTGSVRMQGGEAVIWLIEYDKNNRLQHHKHLLYKTGEFTFSLRTHSSHEKSCIAVQLQGKGSIDIDYISILNKE